MSRFVRPSKYRHVYGTKSKVLYENAKVSGSAWDTDLVTASEKYIAVNWQVSGGGAFAILPSFSPFSPPAPSHFPTKLPDSLPLARGHTAPVLDTAWSPFNDNVVVSAGEDGKNDGWEPADIAPSAKLNAGGRKVGHVTFNPAAENLLASASGDHLIRLWDIEKGQEAPAITLTGHGDSIQSIAWNAVGTTIATTCRDRKLRIFDPRAGTTAVRVGDGHGGIKGSRVVWLGDRDRIATTGFSRMSDRQLSLWETGGLSNILTESLDSSAGIIIPFFAEGNDVLFLAGKGDGNIRYYEFENDQFHFLNEYKTPDPQRGIGFIPRRALDVSQNEIARGFKLSTNSIEPLSFIVPRKAEGFQSDIFPPANSAESALTAADWLGGKTARPNVVDLETRASSANKAPIASSPIKAAAPAATTSASQTPVSRTPASQTPVSQTPPVAKSPTTSTPPPKEEQKSEPTPTPAPAASEAALEAKNLEIEQPEEESEDEAPKKVSPSAAASAAAAIGAGAGAVAAIAAKSPSTSNGSSSVKPPSDELLVQLLSSDAKLPSRGSALSAGYDLYAAADLKIPSRGKGLVSTQISIAVPEGTYGRIAPRSGLAAKHSIDTGAGVIDADYRGEVRVLLFNYGEDDFQVSAGDRIAQLILEKVHMAPIRQVENLDVTTRGAGGFGSTGGFRS